MGNLSCGGFCVNGTVDDKNERIISGGTQDLVMHASDFVKIRSDPVTNTYIIGKFLVPIDDSKVYAPLFKLIEGFLLL